MDDDWVVFDSLVDGLGAFFCGAFGAFTEKEFGAAAAGSLAGAALDALAFLLPDTVNCGS